MGRVVTAIVAAAVVLALWIARTDHGSAGLNDASAAVSTATPRSRETPPPSRPSAPVRADASGSAAALTFHAPQNDLEQKVVSWYAGFAQEQHLTPEQDRTLRRLMRDLKANTQALIEADAEARRDAYDELGKAHPRPGTVLRPPGVQLAEDMTKLDDDLNGELAKIFTPPQVRRFRAYFVNPSAIAVAFPFVE